MKQSPLLDLYRSKGASLIEREHWLLPAHFGDPIAEYEAVRSRVGVLDLCQRNFLRLTGGDRASLLNRTVSNDISALTTGQGLHAAFLDLHGKVLADTRIFCGDDLFLVDLAETRKEAILRHLQDQVASGEVEIEDLSADYAMLSVQGPRAEQLVAEGASSNDLPSLDLAHQQVGIAGANIILIVVTHGAERGYDLVIPVGRLQNVVLHLEEVGQRWSLSWVGIEAQEILRIEAGIPLYGVDITEENFLMETGQDRWVSQHRRLGGLVLEGKQDVQPGAKIYDGEREIGRITSCRFSPQKDSAVALGYIQLDFLAPKTRVTIRDRGKSLGAMVSLLPIS